MPAVVIIVIAIALALYVHGQLKAPRTDGGFTRAEASRKIPDRIPMTEAEKRFGCRFADTVRDEQGRDTGECP